MGWFDEQIKTRKLSDQEILEDSFMKLASAVLGTRISQKSQSQRYPTKEAIDDILKFYHLKPAEIDEEMKQIVDQLDTFLRPHGIMYRSVRLKKGFYKDSIGPILALDKETQKAVALLPGAFSGYAFEDPASGRKEKVKAGNEGRASLFAPGRNTSSFFEITVQLKDKPGALLSVMQPLAEEGLNIRDIELMKVRENVAGTLLLAFKTEDEAARAVKLLRYLGYEVKER